MMESLKDYMIDLYRMFFTSFSQSLSEFHADLHLAKQDPVAKWLLFGRILSMATIFVATTALVIYIPHWLFNRPKRLKKRSKKSYNVSDRNDDDASSLQSDADLLDVTKSPKEGASRYDGERDPATGAKEGHGIMRYKNGTVYNGQWHLNQQHGHGTAYASNGDIYTGSWEEGKRHGKGEMQYNDDSVFVGNFVKGKKHGFGVLTFANLDVIQGVWNAGELVRGMASSSGNVYTGEFKNNTPHGQGTMVFKPISQTQSDEDDDLTDDSSSAAERFASEERSISVSSVDVEGVNDTDSELQALITSTPRAIFDDSGKELQDTEELQLILENPKKYLKDQRKLRSVSPKKHAKREQRHYENLRLRSEMLFESDIYEGQWQNGLMHGIGKYIFGNEVEASNSGAPVHVQGWEGASSDAPPSNNMHHSDSDEDGHEEHRRMTRSTSKATVKDKDKSGHRLSKGLKLAAKAKSLFESADEARKKAQQTPHVFYVGNFKENIQSGFGKIVYANGAEMTGVFVDGNPPTDGTYRSHGSRAVTPDKADENFRVVMEEICSYTGDSHGAMAYTYEGPVVEAISLDSQVYSPVKQNQDGSITASLHELHYYYCYQGTGAEPPDTARYFADDDAAGAGSDSTMREDSSRFGSKADPDSARVLKIDTGSAAAATLVHAVRSEGGDLVSPGGTQYVPKLDLASASKTRPEDDVNVANTDLLDSEIEQKPAKRDRKNRQSAKKATFSGSLASSPKHPPTSPSAQKQMLSTSVNPRIHDIVRRQEYFYAHGKGKMLWENGDTYTGEFRNNLRHGSGIFETSQGLKYVGEWQNDKMHGRGELVYPFAQVAASAHQKQLELAGSGVAEASGRKTSQKKYVGQFKEGMRDGVGTLTFPSGAVYDGQWMKDTKCGIGEYKFANGDIYRGDFSGDKRNGQGIMKFRNGNVFDGQWKEDLKQYGTMTYAANKNQYIGDFSEAGQMHGSGKFIWAGDGSSYDGGWECDVAQGLGTFTCSTYVYTGHWVNNKKQTLDFASASASGSPNAPVSVADSQKATEEEEEAYLAKLDCYKSCEDPTVAEVNFASGDTYKGQYRLGKMTGIGIQYKAVTDEKLRGYFLDGIYQGPIQSQLEQVSGIPKKQENSGWLWNW